MTIHQNSPCDPEPVFGLRVTAARCGITMRGGVRSWTVWPDADPEGDPLGNVTSWEDGPQGSDGWWWLAYHRDQLGPMRDASGRLRWFRTAEAAARALRLASRPRVYRITLCRATAQWQPYRPCMQVLAPGAYQPAHAADLAAALLRVDRIEGRA